MTGSELAKAGYKYLGIPYSKMDCQAFVEKCLSDMGININLAGSNAWFRECRSNGFVGTPEECKAKYGLIPPGAFLFILKHDGKEPAKYKGDGIGNASHIGIYTGDGAIHSSQSRGYVCQSKFAGKSINGGWNYVGLWDRIDYGLKEGEILTATVYASNGKSVNLRKQKSTSSDRLEAVPNETVVEVLEKGAEWCKVKYNGMTGYMMSSFLIFGTVQTDDSSDGEGYIKVARTALQGIYDQIGDILGLRG